MTEHRKMITAYCCAAMMLYAIVMTMISPLILEIAHTFDLAIARVGVLFTFLFIGFTSFIILSSIKADAIGKKRVLNGTLIGYTLALVLMAIAPTFLSVCVAAVFIGGFGGVLESMISAYVHDRNPQRPAYYVNLTQTFFCIGAVFGPPVVGVALSYQISWRICYGVMAGLFFLFTIGFILIRDGKDRQLTKVVHKKKSAPAVSSRNVFQKALVLGCICMFMYTGSEVGAWGWMGTYLDRSFAFTSTTTGVAVALFWGSMAGGRIFCGWLSVKIKPVSIVIALSLTSAVCTAMAAIVQSPVGIFLVISMMGLTYSSQFPLILSYAGARTDVSSGRAFSIMIAGAGFGNMIIPYFMGLIGDAFSMRFAMVLPAVLLSVTAFVFIYFRSTEVAEG